MSWTEKLARAPKCYLSETPRRFGGSLCIAGLHSWMPDSHGEIAPEDHQITGVGFCQQLRPGRFAFTFLTPVRPTTRSWCTRRLQPKSAFSLFSPVRRADLKAPLWVEGGPIVSEGRKVILKGSPCECGRKPSIHREGEIGSPPKKPSLNSPRPYRAVPATRRCGSDDRGQVPHRRAPGDRRTCRPHMARRWGLRKSPS